MAYGSIVYSPFRKTSTSDILLGLTFHMFVNGSGFTCWERSVIYTRLPVARYEESGSESVKCVISVTGSM